MIVRIYYKTLVRFKQNQKNLKTSQKLVRKSLFKQFQQKPNIFFFTENLTLSLPGTSCAGPNTNLPLNSNISETVSEELFKEYLISFLMI